MPAAPPPFPQLVYRGGPVLKNPTLVSITFANDPHRAELDTFAETIGQTQTYWKAIADDYGVGPAKGRSIHLAAAAPATISDAQLRAALTTNLWTDAGIWRAGLAGDLHVLHPGGRRRARPTLGTRSTRPASNRDRSGLRLNGFLLDPDGRLTRQASDDAGHRAACDQ